MLAHALPLGAWSDSAAFDWTMFAAALGIAVVSVLFVVLVPAASLRRADLRDALNRARTGGVHGRGGRLERGLVIAEVALAMLIAMGAALLVRSVANRYAIKPGVETKGIAVVDAIGSAELNSRQRRQAIDEITAALAAMPGVRSAAAAMLLPLRSESNSFDIIVEGHEDRASSFTFFRIVTPSYFSTMGITLLSGRGFQSSDKPDTVEMSVIINDALGEEVFPRREPDRPSSPRRLWNSAAHHRRRVECRRGKIDRAMQFPRGTTRAIKCRGSAPRATCRSRFGRREHATTPPSSTPPAARFSASRRRMRSRERRRWSASSMRPLVRHVR